MAGKKIEAFETLSRAIGIAKNIASLNKIKDKVSFK